MSAVRADDVEMVRAQLRTIVQGAIEGTGDLAASIARLAEIVESLLPEEEPERDPVAGKDYLPLEDLRSILDQPAVAFDPEDHHAPGGA